VVDDGEVARIPSPGTKASPLLSPDGTFLALYWHEPVGEKAEVWHLGGGGPDRVLPPTPALHVAFSPDGRRLALLKWDHQVEVRALPSLRVESTTSPAGVGPLVFRGDGRQLAVATPLMVRIFDVATGHRIHQFNVSNIGAHALAWHPDGRTLAVAEGSRVNLLDVSSGRPSFGPLANPGGGTALAFSADGELLATSSTWSATVRVCHTRTGETLFTAPAGVVFQGESAGGGLLGYDLSNGKVRRWELSSSPVYRTLVRPSTGGMLPVYQTPAVHPGGRLLAVGSHDGIDLWDLDRGEFVAFLRAGDCRSVAWESAESLVSFGESGLRRWPVTADPVRPGGFRVGPAERLPARAAPLNAHAVPGVPIVAAAEYSHAVVLHRGVVDIPTFLNGPKDVRDVAVSPDGRYVATGCHDGPGAQVWDPVTGRRLHDFPVGPVCPVDWSPDGRWFATGSDAGGGCRLWEVGTWKPGPVIGGLLTHTGAFSPDGRYVAAETGGGVLRVVEVDSGREAARLEDPSGDRAETRAWSPDGGRLVVVAHGQRSVHVWDLRAARRELEAVRLADGFPALPPRPAPPGPIALRVVDTDGRPFPPAELATRGTAYLLFAARRTRIFVTRALAITAGWLAPKSDRAGGPPAAAGARPTVRQRP
jgi:WD40 repeat protein